MKVSSEKLENCEVMLTIEVDEGRVDSALKSAARKISQQTNIPGFRKGKAPYHIVLQMFGRGALLEEALEDLGQEVYKEALQETGIEPFAQAEIADVQLDPLVFKMKVPLPPEIDLGDYRDLRIETPAVEVSEDEVNDSVNALRQSNLSWVPVDRESRWDDMLNFSVKVRSPSDEGEEAQETEESTQEMILSKDDPASIPGFQENLLGVKAGETVNFDISYPSDWKTPSIRDKTVHFTVQMLDVKESELPPLEELPALVGDYDDLDALREELRHSLLTDKQAEADQELFEKAVTILSEQVHIAYPNVLLEEEIDSLIRRHETALQQQGLNMESYLKVLKTDMESYREKLRPDGVTSLQRSLILGKLVELERLRVDEQEISDEIGARSDRYPGQSGELRELLSSPAGMRFVMPEVLSDKAKRRLLDIVKGVAPELPAEEPENDNIEAASEPEVTSEGAVENVAPASGDESPHVESES